MPDSDDEAREGDDEHSEPVAAPPTPADYPEDEPHPSEGLQIHGEVRSIQRVPANTVPSGYPAAITTEKALAMELVIGGPDDVVVVTYFASPLRGMDDRLERLCELAGVDEYEDLTERSVLVTVEDGFYLPVVPDDPHRGSGRGVYGIALGLAPSIFIGLVGIFAPGSSIIASTPFVLAWFFGTFLVLPASVYIDAQNLRSRTNWVGTPRNWAVLSAIPPINVLAVPLYLIARENAEPIV